MKCYFKMVCVSTFNFVTGLQNTFFRSGIWKVRSRGGLWLGYSFKSHCGSSSFSVQQWFAWTDSRVVPLILRSPDLCQSHKHWLYKIWLHVRVERRGQRGRRSMYEREWLTTCIPKSPEESRSETRCSAEESAVINSYLLELVLSNSLSW